MRAFALSLILLASLGGAAQAEVAERSAQGFTSKTVVSVAAPKARAWEALLAPAKWWAPSHTYSGSAANLVMDLERDCFCELLPGRGRVRHMTVVYADGATLRLFGGLGPLQTTGASGHLILSVKDAGRGSEITLTYAVSGHATGGLAETWAAPVDGVLGQQLARLKRYLETGKPE
jgi:hypothetical protein